MSTFCGRRLRLNYREIFAEKSEGFENLEMIRMKKWMSLKIKIIMHPHIIDLSGIK